MFSPNIKKKSWEIFSLTSSVSLCFESYYWFAFALGVWEFFSVFSIFVYASFGDRTRPQHQETTETSQKDVKNFVECGY